VITLDFYLNNGNPRATLQIRQPDWEAAIFTKYRLEKTCFKRSIKPWKKNFRKDLISGDIFDGAITGSAITGSAITGSAITGSAIANGTSSTSHQVDHQKSR
jgi:hypothetical protein